VPLSTTSIASAAASWSPSMVPTRAPRRASALRWQISSSPAGSLQSTGTNYIFLSFFFFFFSSSLWLISARPGGGEPRTLGLSRPYPRAVAGMPINTTFARASATKDFAFCFHLDLRIGQPTEVFVDFPTYYPNGVVVTSTPNVDANVDESKMVVTLLPNSRAVQNSTVCFEMQGKSL
jgi:hypothetical protein